jgi:hypothetical protein
MEFSGHSFWPAVAALGGPRFAAAVDYAGLDMYPDVFGPRFAVEQLDGELFTLRDADSSNDDLFHQFGVLRDDYTPKPAFDRLRALFAELR